MHKATPVDSIKFWGRKTLRILYTKPKHNETTHLVIPDVDGRIILNYFSKKFVEMA
jgi:hypothetical protein